MKKIILFLLISFVLYGCESSKTIAAGLDPWMGHSKEQLISQWGPPNQTTSNGHDGEVLIYATRFYRYLPNGTTLDTWHYRMMYANGLGTLYHWIYKSSPIAPERIDVRLLN